MAVETARARIAGCTFTDTTREGESAIQSSQNQNRTVDEGSHGHGNGVAASEPCGHRPQRGNCRSSPAERGTRTHLKIFDLITDLELEDAQESINWLAWE